MLLLLLMMISTCSVVSYTDGLTRCFECTDMPHPADCTSLTVCSDEQQCVLKQYVTSGGLVLYSSGCLSKTWCEKLENRDTGKSRSKRSDVATCQECCRGALCNNQGCGVKALSQPERGPYCFDCSTLEDPTACLTVKTCPPKHVCMLHEVTSSTPFNPPVYTSSCTTAVDCHARSSPVAVDRRSRFSSRDNEGTCNTCCETDFCNDQCGVMIKDQRYKRSTSVTTPTSMISVTSSIVTDMPSTKGLTRCFECTDIPHPADCTRTTFCSEQQQCVLKQYVTSGGLVLFSSGCLSKNWCGKDDKEGPTKSRSKRSDVIMCHECCNGELCNNEGCGVKALSQPQRGPYCFNCHLLEDPSACRTVTACPPNHVCMLQDVTPSSASGNIVYASSCVPVSDCNSYNNLLPIGKRNNVGFHHERGTCHTCCDADFCNDHCGTTVTDASSSTPVTSTPTTTSSSVVSTASSTAVSSVASTSPTSTVISSTGGLTSPTVPVTILMSIYNSTVSTDGNYASTNRLDPTAVISYVFLFINLIYSRYIS